MGEKKRVLLPANRCASVSHKNKMAVLNPKADRAAKQENDHNFFDPRLPDILVRFHRWGEQLDIFPGIVPDPFSLFLKVDDTVTISNKPAVFLRYDVPTSMNHSSIDSVESFLRRFAQPKTCRHILLCEEGNRWMRRFVPRPLIP